MLAGVDPRDERERMTRLPTPTTVPRVTVITIFHNAEAFFRDAIESVLAQGFEDFELLLVDDGSADRSTAIALDYAARDHRIQYFSHPGRSNRGMSATRNVGLSAARGEFVAFIDADDRWRPCKLMEQIELLDRMPDVDAVGGSVVYWKSHAGGSDRIVPTAHVRDRPIPPGEATVKLYPLGRAHAPSMSDLLFRRSAIECVGGFEETFTGAYEDQAFLAKFYLSSTLYVTKNIWSDYRIHPASCVARVARHGTYDASRRSFLEWFEDYLADSRFRDDDSIHRALDRAVSRNARLQGQKRGLRHIIRLHSPAMLVRAVRTAKAARNRLRPMLTPGAVILMYHRVADESFDPWGVAVSPAHFADQLEWLVGNRTVLPLPELAELNKLGKMPRDAVAVTFDDGYACNGRVAIPMLERLDLPATIFLPPALIEFGREFWWDELQRIIWNAKSASLNLRGMSVRIGEACVADDDWKLGNPPRTARQRAYQRLYSILYALQPREIDAGMVELRQQSNVPVTPRESHRPLSPEEIRALTSGLVEFGSHALSHPSLPLLSAAEKAREINEGRQRCADLTDTPCRSFAYPYGDVDAESRDFVKAAGFVCACRADGWFVRSGADPFALPRIHVGNWNSDKLAKLIGRG